MLNMYSYVIKRSLERKINDLDKENYKFFIFPYGYFGKIVYQILKEELGIKNITILDNYVEDCTRLEYLRDYVMKENEYVIITGNRADIYEEIRNEVREVVKEEKIIDIFEMHYGENENVQNIYALSEYNVRFYLPYWKKDYIQNWIFRWGTYFEEVNLNYINNVFKDGVIKKAKGGVLDIGANIGNHALYFALEGNADFVYAFEPIEDTFKILKKNVQINNLETNILLFNCAVGAKHVMTTITNYHDDNIGGTQLAYSDKGNIECITIDDMKIEKDIKLIKIDVEGFEAEVIIGARQTIAEKQPYILVEIWSMENMQIIEDVLRPLRYGCVQIALHDYLFYRT